MVAWKSMKTRFDAFWHVMTCFDMLWHVMTCFDTNWFILDILAFFLLSSSRDIECFLGWHLLFFVIKMTDFYAFWYVLMRFDEFWHVLTHINIFSFFTNRQDIQCFGDDTCYSLAFGVPAVLMLIATVILVIGKNLWIKGLLKVKKP